MILPLPFPLLALWLALLALGVGFWIQYWMHEDLWRPDLEEGGVWLDWRPLPEGLGLGSLLVILIGLLAQGLLFFPVLGEVPLEEISPALLQSVSIATMHLPVTIFIFWWIPRQRLPVGEALGLQKPVWKLSSLLSGSKGYLLSLPLTAIAGLLTALGLNWLDLDFSPQLAVSSLKNLSSPLEVGIIVLLIGFLGPFCEEVLFRGVLFPLFRKKMSIGLANLLQSLLFALVHLHFPGFLPLLVLSLVLGWVYQATRDLMAAFWMHAIFNCMTLIVVFVTAGGAGA